jgi:hypothetical protein
MAARLKLLRSVQGHPDAHVVLAPFTKLPHATFFGDVRPDPDDYVNRGVASYYGIADVSLGTENRVRFGDR